MWAEIEPELREMGRLSGGPLYAVQLTDRLNEPRLTQWSAWGERIDAIELTPLWQQAERIAAELGVVAVAYERRHGTPAEPVQWLSGGVRDIAPMLNVTWTWNAVSAVALMRRGIALARDYARRREAFGATLDRQPLHVDTLAGLQAEFEGAFHLAFRVVELLGRREAGEAAPTEVALLRVLTPIAKLTTARQGVAVASEVVEAFGGAGYVEDTGIPALLRDAQVLSIWEGTTNVLSLDVLRAMEAEGALDALLEEVERCAAAVHAPHLCRAVDAAREAVDHAVAWRIPLRERPGPASTEVEQGGARRFALTLGRALELALLCRHAQWSTDHERDDRASIAALRLMVNGIDQVLDPEAAVDYSFALARDQRAHVWTLPESPPQPPFDAEAEAARWTVRREEAGLSHDFDE